MAGYGYQYRNGYTTYTNGPPMPGGAEGWNKTSYNSDHEHQPVFVDADGRRKSVMSYGSESYGTPNGRIEYHVTRTEIVERPQYMAEYKQRTPIRVEMVRDYGDVDSKLISRPLSPEKWQKSSSPVRHHAEEKWNRPSSPVRYHTEEKWKKSSSPDRHHAEEKWNKKPSSPVQHRAEEKWINRPSSPDHERPQEVEDFLTKVQTQASRPKFGPLSATYWRQTPTVTTNTTSGSWANPSHGGEWSKGKVANLSQPTNDINTAVEYLKEAVKPPSSRYGGYSTIDSKEAERRYGGLSAGPPPMGSYGRTIDSRAAARKYGGTAV